MIQRIQSLYLSLTIILSLLLIKGSILTFFDNSGAAINITFSGIVKVIEGQSTELIGKLIPLSALIIAIPAIALITILLFKNRKVQMRLTIMGTILTISLIGLLAYHSYSIIDKYNASIRPGLKMIFPILILIFNILAYIGIRKDERLVKSYDRLR